LAEGIYGILRGLKFELAAKVEQKGPFLKDLMMRYSRIISRGLKSMPAALIGQEGSFFKDLIKPYRLKNLNFWFMILGDCAFLLFSYFFAYYLRFDGYIPPDYLIGLKQTIIWFVLLKIVCLFLLGLYRGMWRYTSIHDMIRLIVACLISSGVFVLFLFVSMGFQGFSRGVFVIDFLLAFIFLGGYRLVVRLFYTGKNGGNKLTLSKRKKIDGRRVLLVGAGDAGEKLLREIRGNPAIQYHVVGFIDDDRSKLKKSIHGVPILGPTDEIRTIAPKKRIDEIVIAIPAASASEMRRIVKTCEATGLDCKTVPGIGELIEGKITVGAIRRIRYEDLLGRKQVMLDMEKIGGYLSDKRVLVTGGAGSIGSELSNQIARFGPEKLIIVDMNETGLYDMELDLSEKFPEMQIVSFLSSIENMNAMRRILEQQKPQVVFHAAAYKHVPMMELHPWEAVLNNIVGTQTLLSVCANNGVDRCVVVSTDKAVRPTNVMGASKRVCEILTQIYAKENGAKFMAVRFGNVVYSSGSVVPLFRKQIQRGGPITLTHPEVMRYFMSIPEASRLILQAGAIGSGGEIFILKMGTPIRIADMAKDLIRLSDMVPGEDIKIIEVGLRPGEKLFEELITDGEGIQETEHKEIMVLRGDIDFSMKEMKEHIEKLVDLAEAGDGKGIRDELKRIVPEYTPQLAENPGGIFQGQFHEAKI